MGRSALIVVDTQANMFDEAFSVYDGDRILKTINSLIDKARKAEIHVIYIRNNGPADEPDQPGTPGWHIHPLITPESGDLIIDKSGPDPFEGTDLEQKLGSLEIDRVIVAGMQTELCISTTVRQAARRGFAVTLVKDGHTTFNWDDITAVEAIRKHNLELSKYADIVTEKDIDPVYLNNCSGSA